MSKTNESTMVQTPRPKATLAARFGFAFRGIGMLMAEQPIHAAATVGVLVTGLIVGLDAWQWCAILFAVGLVWTAESLNTALERLADAVHPANHPLVGQAKDVAAGGVLLAAIAAVAIGAVVIAARFGGPNRSRFTDNGGLESPQPSEKMTNRNLALCDLHP